MQLLKSEKPPIQLLPAFEAAARLQSFKKAADELKITPSAISQQIKQLEERLGIQLFYRANRQVILTEAGGNFNRIAHAVLSSYSNEIENFKKSFCTPKLCIGVSPCIKHELIIPALSDFYQAHPSVELHLDSSIDSKTIRNSKLDAAIRFGGSDWQGLKARSLSEATAMFVCSPKLLQKKPINKLEDLQQHTLIHTNGADDNCAANAANEWEEMSRLLGVEHIKGKKVLVVDGFLAAWKAAAEGLGIAIGVAPVVNKWIYSDELVSVFRTPIVIPTNFYFVFQETESNKKSLETFYNVTKSIFHNLWLEGSKTQPMSLSQNPGGI